LNLRDFKYNTPTNQRWEKLK